MRHSRRFLVLVALLTSLIFQDEAGAQFVQQGNKLVGTGAVGSYYEGTSVAFSADGSTAIVGGYNDCGGTGAAWVYTRIGGVWTQQGNKLVGTGAVGSANQGYSVALSADGNTAILGGPYDNSSTGAAWVFTRSGGVWSQPGQKLVGTGGVSFSRQGYSVALSSDGNTAIVGGSGDDASRGAAWVFIRSGDVWTQEGGKLVGTGATGNAYQGCSVSLSAAGDTAIVGGYADNSNAGAVWVYTRSAGVWSQEGSKLVGTGAVGSARQGWSVSLSSDGNTALVGGYGDNSNQGAVWVFTHSGGVWSQQGEKLVGTGAVGSANQGYSVSLSPDGNTAIAGGRNDNSSRGAAWVYTRSGGVWTQQGNKLVGTGAAGSARQGSSVSLSSDGNTAVVGGPGDNSNIGAAWVYARSGGVWSQDGGKLVGAGAIGAAVQGSSVTISADGNTALAGGPEDNNSVGAVWVFTRSGGAWSQEGNKLVGTGAVGSSSQGTSVALSSDGNTAIVGGQGDNSSAGAAWIFTRSGGVWTQQGTKLVGTGAVGSARQGCSVSLSADGNTAIVGGYSDYSNTGAAWVFTRSGGVWSQEGSKLVGTGALGAARQGCSVSLASDGNTAIVGGHADNDNSIAGASWVFTRSGGVWSQQGSKLVGTGTAGSAGQGYSVSLSGDGNTAVVGGPYENGQDGAVWVFTRSGGLWSQQGSKIVATDATSRAFQGISVSVSSDGSTALVGGEGDSRDAGAAWIYTRSTGVWSQLGNKLVGTDAVGDGYVYQGSSVSLSADGNTAIVGGHHDNGGVGAVWVFVRIETAVEDHSEGTPRGFGLAQNYPNPFNPTTSVCYQLPVAGDVRLTVYDVLGREVATLVNEWKAPGRYNVRFDAAGLSGGVYFYRLKAGGFAETRRLLLLR